MDPPPGHFVSRRSFADSDEAAASISCSQVEYALLGPPRRDWTIVEARLGDIVASAGETGAAFGAAGSTYRNVHTFLVPLTHSTNWTVNGRAITPHTMACFSPNTEHVAAIGDPVEWAVVQMTPDVFESIFETYSGRAFSRRSRGAIFTPAPEAFADLKNAVRTAAKCATSRPDLIDNEAIRNTLRKIILDSLLEVFPSQGSRDTALPYRELALRTRDFLREHGERPVYAADLTEFLGISERSLRRLFHEVFGTSPAHYLRVRRFHQARRALKDPRQAASVTGISTSLGFFDLGRFASDYRELFGELPSQTLARRR